MQNKSRRLISSFIYENGINHSNRKKKTAEDEGIPKENLLTVLNIGYEIDDNRHFIRGSFRDKPKMFFNVYIEKDELVGWAEEIAKIGNTSFFDKKEDRQIKNEEHMQQQLKLLEE